MSETSQCPVDRRGSPSTETTRRNDGYTVALENIEINARVGLYAHEKLGTQRVRISVHVRTNKVGLDTATIEGWVTRVVSAGHVVLVETMAERIAAVGLSDPVTAEIMVRVEKLEIFKDAIIGVEIVRRRGGAPP